MGERALVTGLGGFTGAYMARKLESLGYEVHGLEMLQDSDASRSVDLREAEAVSSLVEWVQPRVVVHLAAVAFVGHGDIADIYTSNVIGTRNLLSSLAQLEQKPEAVLLASSANVYGNATVEPIGESCVPCPENDYAVSKCAMEMMARCWRHELPLLVTRPFNYTGVGQSLSFLIPKIVDHFARRAPTIELGNTDVYRDFSDVRDVVTAYASLLSAGEPGQTYNICSGQVYSLRQVLAMLADIAGYEIEVQVNPAFVRDNEVKRLVGDNSLLTATIGQQQDRIPLADTLEWMYKSRIGS